MGTSSHFQSNLSLFLNNTLNLYIMAPSTITPDLVPEPVSKLPERPRADGSALNEHERAEIAFVDKYSAPDVYINGKNDTLWFPWIGPIDLRLPLSTNTAPPMSISTGKTILCGSLGSAPLS